MVLLYLEGLQNLSAVIHFDSECSEAGEVVSRMSAGDFFGEIGILNMEGGVNRRTADVRSVGYSELFVLSRDDVLDALKDHPDADVSNGFSSSKFLRSRILPSS